MYTSHIISKYWYITILYYSLLNADIFNILYLFLRPWSLVPILKRYWVYVNDVDYVSGPSTPVINIILVADLYIILVFVHSCILSRVSIHAIQYFYFSILIRFEWPGRLVCTKNLIVIMSESACCLVCPSIGRVWFLVAYYQCY